MGWYISIILLAALAPLTDILGRFLQRRVERKGHPLPPGPTPLPFLGSVLSVNAQQPWLTFTEWRAKYGDIMYVRLLDTDFIVLNSMSVATELLDKRSSIYSDRPLIATLEPYGLGCNFALAQYGTRWRSCRRIFQQTFHASAALSFRPMQLRRARELVFNIIDDANSDNPMGCQFHFNMFSASVAMSAVYDYVPIPRNDPMVSTANNFVQASVLALAPARIILVKFFPFLLHMPDWFPGSWIRREAKVAYEWSTKMVETPYQYVKERMKSEDHLNAAMVSDHITRMENLSGSNRSEYEATLKLVAATAFLGSSVTSDAILMTFLLGMVQNPRVWKRAHIEIDAVLGTERLPELEDRASLPYVDAIVRETLRWRPALPILPARTITRSDIYNGYYIPKGAIIRVNAWAMSRDPARYPDAEEFIPERFLDSEGRLTDDNPAEFIFGFGRRRCAGVHVADPSLWGAIATMLATLDFNLAKDADGNHIMFEATFTNEVIDHPHPFPCQVTPRAHVSKEALHDILAK